MFRFLFILIFCCLADVDLHAGSPDVKIITYNIRYENRGDRGVRSWRVRKDHVVSYLRDSKAGIIGIQEALHEQVKDLDKALPDFHYVGVGRTDGIKRGEYTPIFYDTKFWKLDARECGTFWLSDIPGTAGSKSWGNEIPRICTWARLIDATGKAIYIYNTHWDHRSQASRLKAAELILKMIHSRTHGGDPFILMGDLNATTENPAIKTLLGSSVMKDLGKKQWKTFSSWRAKLVPGHRIDHIFTSASISKAAVVVESNGDGVSHAASDHHPVVLTMVWPIVSQARSPSRAPSE